MQDYYMTTSLAIFEMTYTGCQSRNASSTSCAFKPTSAYTVRHQCTSPFTSLLRFDSTRTSFGDTRDIVGATNKIKKRWSKLCRCSAYTLQWTIAWIARLPPLSWQISQKFKKIQKYKELKNFLFKRAYFWVWTFLDDCC